MRRLDKWAVNEKYGIPLFLLPLLLLFNSCSDSNKKGSKEVAFIDTNKKVEVRGTIVQQSTDSFLNILRNAQKVYVGDFDTMLKRRIIRVLVPYSRTLFFNDKGRERGITADNFRQFEEYLNKKYYKKPHSIPFTVAFIPTPRSQLIDHLQQGLGDIAAGNLTATEKRLQQVDFLAPKEQGSVSEIVINRIKDPPITNTKQLAGKTIHVRKSSSYFESLQKLNKRLLSEGKSLARITIVADDLEDEDLMEMLNAGVISVIIVDDWKAKMWAQILPGIRVNEQAAVSSGGYVGCAFRKNSPLLTAELKDFYYNYERKLASMPYRLKKYYQEVKHLQNPTNADNANRYNEIIQLFEKYGNKYNFDPLMLTAMGFQESKLDQAKRSPVGAIGVMQLMPATGAEMKVGDIKITDANIHAGTKFMNLLMTTYFKDAHFDPFNRSLFAFASYNAGPGKIASLRKLAAERGLNPDVWLNNVEIVTSEKIGMETTTYVRNVMKYYYSYKLMLERSKEKAKALPTSIAKKSN